MKCGAVLRPREGIFAGRVFVCDVEADNPNHDMPGPDGLIRHHRDSAGALNWVGHLVRMIGPVTPDWYCDEAEPDDDDLDFMKTHCNCWPYACCACGAHGPDWEDNE